MRSSDGENHRDGLFGLCFFFPPPYLLVHVNNSLLGFFFRWAMPGDFIFKLCFCHHLHQTTTVDHPLRGEKRWTWRRILKRELFRVARKYEKMLRWKMVEICYGTRNNADGMGKAGMLSFVSTLSEWWRCHCWYSSWWEKVFPKPCSRFAAANPLPRLCPLYNPTSVEKYKLDFVQFSGSLVGSWRNGFNASRAIRGLVRKNVMIYIIDEAERFVFVNYKRSLIRVN